MRTHVVAPLLTLSLAAWSLAAAPASAQKYGGGKFGPSQAEKKYEARQASACACTGGRTWDSYDHIQEEAIRTAAKASGGDKGKLASSLDMDAADLDSAMTKYGIALSGQSGISGGGKVGGGGGVKSWPGLEETLVRNVLEASKGDIACSARCLGMKRRDFSNLVQKYRIESPRGNMDYGKIGRRP